jgi:uroporphyrinogen decarboxylase
MNSRERALISLAHKEPDRIPLDLGGTVDSSVSAITYRRLRDHLGPGAGKTRVADVLQHTALMEEDIRKALSVDVMLVGAEPRSWRKGTLPDGSQAEFPSKFVPEQQDDGCQVLRDAAGNVILKMPQQGHYFDPVFSPLQDATSVREIGRHMEAIECYDTPSYLDKSYEEISATAKILRQTTDYLLVGFFGGHIFQAAQSLRGWEAFLVDLMVNVKFADALMDKLTEANLRRFDHFAKAVGPHVDVVQFEDDLGMQDPALLRPDLYRRVVKPYHERLFRFARSQCSA